MTILNLQIPNYQLNPSVEQGAEENYQQELNQTLQQLIGSNGWQIAQISHANLTTTPILDPNLGTFTTVQAQAPNGAVWYVIDSSPPIFVGKVDGSLYKFTMSAYP